MNITRNKKNMLRGGGAFALTLALFSLAFASGWTCDPGELPWCNDPSEFVCPDSGVVRYGDQYDGFWYACNGTSDDCPVDPGKCGVIVKYAVKVRNVYCQLGVNETFMGVCADEADFDGTSINKKCDDTKCNPFETAEDIGTIPGAGDQGLDFVEFLEIHFLGMPM